MPKTCDHTSVGVVIKDPAGHVALIERGHFPIGIAPPAGHVDDHGSYEQAAIDEVGEEIGVQITLGGLREAIPTRRVDNTCKRTDGDHHNWRVYEYELAEDEVVELQPDARETKGAFWADSTRLQSLADRTRAYQAGEIDNAAWEAEPGLEEIWLDFLVELGYVE